MSYFSSLGNLLVTRFTCSEDLLRRLV